MDCGCGLWFPFTTTTTILLLLLLIWWLFSPLEFGSRLLDGGCLEEEPRPPLPPLPALLLFLLPLDFAAPPRPPFDLLRALLFIDDVESFNMDELLLVDENRLRLFWGDDGDDGWFSSAAGSVILLWRFELDCINGDSVAAVALFDAKEHGNGVTPSIGSVGSFPDAMGLLQCRLLQSTPRTEWASRRYFGQSFTGLG